MFDKTKRNMLSMFSHHQQSHEQVYNYSSAIPEEHKASLTHEILSGAVGFFAMKAYQDHQRKLGHPVHNQFAKEILASIAAAEVDRLIETKGLDWIDRHKAKRNAVEQAQQMYDQQYADKSMENYDQNQFDWHQFHQNAQQFREPSTNTSYIAGQQQHYQQQNYQQTATYQEYQPQQYMQPQNQSVMGGQQYYQEGYQPQQYSPLQYPPQEYPPQQYSPQQYPPQQYPSQEYPPQQYHQGQY
ncbi:hypothetical protein SeLEV6574_g00143 [Synchytrium endobioticum]|uniref:Uncharacterized protein n=1 Tax=Synchytrium endobioticum TaxID=286115 RepID=A0A507DJE2_9FUNG|nr:hypothetical protein SeLEV6574_g00143 [Synchytrium endobioticum]